MATTSQKIAKALSIMEAHDWYWCMADYSAPAYSNAFITMRSFVEVVASIADATIVKALRELWTAKYKYIHATMWESNPEAKKSFEAKESELMAIIQPLYSVAA